MEAKTFYVFQLKNCCLWKIGCRVLVNKKLRLEMSCLGNQLFFVETMLILFCFKNSIPDLKFYWLVVIFYQSFMEDYSQRHPLNWGMCSWLSLVLFDWFHLKFVSYWYYLKFHLKQAKIRSKYIFGMNINLLLYVLTKLFCEFLFGPMFD